MHTHMCVCVCTHTHMWKIICSLKKNKILSFAATWMDFEGIKLCEIDQTKISQTKTPYDLTYCGI